MQLMVEVKGASPTVGSAVRYAVGAWSCSTVIVSESESLSPSSSSAAVLQGRYNLPAGEAAVPKES